MAESRHHAALARCVDDPAAFLTGAFATEPVLRRGGGGGAGANGYDDLLSLADVDAQISGAGLRRPAVRLARDGEILPGASFSRRARTGSVWIDDLVDPARTFAAFADGATVVLQSLHRWWPPLTQFCRQLEDELGHPVQVNAYLTPPGAAGFAPHHDTHDVFVLQVHGTKQWTVRDPVLDDPLERHRSDHDVAARQPVRFQAELAPGDCLYLPRGFVHSAASQAEASLHLTIGVLAVSRHDLLRRLVDRTAEVPELRRTLPAGYASDTAAAARVVKESIAELIAWLEQLDVDDVAADLVDREARRRAPVLDGQLLELSRLHHLDDTTRVQVRPGVRWRVDVVGDVGAGDGRLRVVLADRELDLPAAAQPALDRLLDGEAHAVADLADLADGPSRLVLVRRLVREGVLRTVATDVGTSGP
jgi:bifunctional lysine-specific demethylase and histidyl-hydroxylase NO66